jgi:hypothetical protein
MKPILSLGCKIGTPNGCLLNSEGNKLIFFGGISKVAKK